MDGDSGLKYWKHDDGREGRYGTEHVQIDISGNYSVLLQFWLIEMMLGFFTIFCNIEEHCTWTCIGAW